MSLTWARDLMSCALLIAEIWSYRPLNGFLSEPMPIVLHGAEVFPGGWALRMARTID